MKKYARLWLVFGLVAVLLLGVSALTSVVNARFGEHSPFNYWTWNEYTSCEEWSTDSAGPLCLGPLLMVHTNQSAWTTPTLAADLAAAGYPQDCGGVDADDENALITLHCQGDCPPDMAYLRISGGTVYTIGITEHNDNPYSDFSVYGFYFDEWLAGDVFKLQIVTDTYRSSYIEEVQLVCLKPDDFIPSTPTPTPSPTPEIPEGYWFVELGESCASEPITLENGCLPFQIDNVATGEGWSFTSQEGLRVCSENPSMPITATILFDYIQLQASNYSPKYVQAASNDNDYHIVSREWYLLDHGCDTEEYTEQTFSISNTTTGIYASSDLYVATYLDNGFCGAMGYAHYAGMICPFVSGPYTPTNPTPEPTPLPSLCGDGVELLTTTHVISLSEQWTCYTDTAMSLLKARFTLGAPEEHGILYGVASLNEDDKNFSIDAGDAETRTIESGVELGPSAALTITNDSGQYGEYFTLASVCLIEQGYDCTFDDYHFDTGWNGWILDWGMEWETGTIHFGTYETYTLILQHNLYDMDIEPGRYTISARVKQDTETPTVTERLTMTVFLSDGYEIYPRYRKAVTLTTEYQTITMPVAIDEDTPIVRLESAQAYVDYVCLTPYGSIPPGGDDDTAWEYPLPTCDPPTLDDHPAFEITALADWVFWTVQKLYSFWIHGVCLLTQAMARVANWGVGVIVAALAGLGVDTGDLEVFSLLDLLKALAGYFSRAWLVGATWLIDEILPVLPEWLRVQVQAIIDSARNIAQRAAILVNIYRQLWQSGAEDMVNAFEALIDYLHSIAEVGEVIVTPLRSAFASDSLYDFGIEAGWQVYMTMGINAVDDLIDGTPLEVINTVSIGIIALGVGMWTLKSLKRIIKNVASMLTP